MKGRSQAFLVLPFFLIFLVMGCYTNKVGVPEWSGSGFLRKEFLEYRSVAILPFGGDDSGEVSDAFTESFHERFPQIAIVDRKRFLEFFGDPALNTGQLNDAMREKVGKTLAVEALIRGDVYYLSILRWLLQVEIVDTGTGKMIGRSMVEINFMGAEGKKKGARFAVEKLTFW